MNKKQIKSVWVDEAIKHGANKKIGADTRRNKIQRSKLVFVKEVKSSYLVQKLLNF